MAITNQQVVRFSNDQLRPLADRLGAALYGVQAAVAEWEAKGLAALVPDDPAEVVQDGSATDGRTPVSGADVHALIGYCVSLLSSVVADSSDRNTVLKFAVNPRDR